MRTLPGLVGIFGLCALTALLGLASMPPAPRADMDGAETFAPARVFRAEPLPLNQLSFDGREGARPDEMIVPVRGVRRAELADTWGAARSERRTHQGVDIMAPSGVEVLATADGRIAKLYRSTRGGLTIYQFDAGERYAFYYAHLSAYARDLREGDLVRQGQVIGYVGSTGNATTPHLHFELQRLTEERRWWRGEAINAYPFLRAGHLPPD